MDRPRPAPAPAVVKAAHSAAPPPLPEKAPFLPTEAELASLQRTLPTGGHLASTGRAVPEAVSGATAITPSACRSHRGKQCLSRRGWLPRTGPLPGEQTVAAADAACPVSTTSRNLFGKSGSSTGWEEAERCLMAGCKWPTRQARIPRDIEDVKPHWRAFASGQQLSKPRAWIAAIRRLQNRLAGPVCRMAPPAPSHCGDTCEKLAPPFVVPDPRSAAGAGRRRRSRDPCAHQQMLWSVERRIGPGSMAGATTERDSSFRRQRMTESMHRMRVGLTPSMMAATPMPPAVQTEISPRRRRSAPGAWPASRGCARRSRRTDGHRRGSSP